VRRFVGIALAVAFLGGGPSCGRDKREETRVSEAPRGVVAASPVPTPVAAMPYEPPEPPDGVFGHLRIADPFAVLAKISDQLAPPSASGQLTVDALRGAAREQARSKLGTALAEHADLGRVFACVLLDPSRHGVPLSCVFGYEGGLDGMVSALGPPPTAPARPHSAQYDIDGLTVYLDALGPDIVVAFDGQAFADSRDYLEGLARRGGAWDLDLTLFPAAAAGRYEPQLEVAAATLLTELAPMADDPAMRVITRLASRELSVLIPLLTWRGGAVARELLDAAGAVDRVQIGVRLDGDGLVASAIVDPSALGGMRRQLTAQPAVASEQLSWIPLHTWFSMASAGAEPRLPLSRGLVRELALELLGDAVGLPPGAATDAWAALTSGASTTYAPGGLLVAFNGPDTWGGLGVVRSLEPERSGTAAWRREVESATPESIFGAEAARELTKIVQWSLRTSAFEVDGVEVDRWKVEARRAFIRKLRASLGEEDSVADALVGWVETRPALVAIDRFEADEHAVVAWAPGGGEGYATRLLDAGRGRGRADAAWLEQQIARHPRLLAFAAVSVRDLVRFAHELLPPDLAAQLPTEAGQGLGDVFAGAWVTEDGRWIGELVVGQALLDLVRTRAN
jgi:hypothetical protein